MREATEATARKRTVREIEGIVDVTTVTTAVTDGATGTATAATVVKTVAGTSVETTVETNVETTVETTAGIETGTATTGGKNGSEEAGKTALSVHLAAFVKFLSVICNSSVSSACFLIWCILNFILPLTFRFHETASDSGSRRRSPSSRSPTLSMT